MQIERSKYVYIELKRKENKKKWNNQDKLNRAFCGLLLEMPSTCIYGHTYLRNLHFYNPQWINLPSVELCDALICFYTRIFYIGKHNRGIKVWTWFKTRIRYLIIPLSYAHRSALHQHRSCSPQYTFKFEHSTISKASPSNTINTRIDLFTSKQTVTSLTFPSNSHVDKMHQECFQTVYYR